MKQLILLLFYWRTPAIKTLQVSSATFRSVISSMTESTGTVWSRVLYPVYTALILELSNMFNIASIDQAGSTSHAK